MLICSIICPLWRQLYPQAAWRDVSVDLILFPVTSIRVTVGVFTSAAIRNGATTQQMLQLIVSAERFAWVFFLLRPLYLQLPSELEPDVDDCCASATRAQSHFSIFPPNRWHRSYITTWPMGLLSKVCLTLKKRALFVLESFMTFLGGTLWERC